MLKKWFWFIMLVIIFYFRPRQVPPGWTWQALAIWTCRAPPTIRNASDLKIDLNPGKGKPYKTSQAAQYELCMLLCVNFNAAINLAWFHSSVIGIPPHTVSVKSVQTRITINHGRTATVHRFGVCCGAHCRNWGQSCKSEEITLWEWGSHFTYCNRSGKP